MIESQDNIVSVCFVLIVSQDNTFSCLSYSARSGSFVGRADDSLLVGNMSWLNSMCSADEGAPKRAGPAPAESAKKRRKVVVEGAPTRAGPAPAESAKKRKVVVEAQSDKPPHVPMLRRATVGHVSAKKMMDGTFLDSLADDAVNDMDISCLLASGGVHTYGTICSGSEVFSVAVKAFERALRRKGGQHAFSCKYMCEINSMKHAWLREVSEKLEPGKCACLYEDCANIGKCVVHGRACPLAVVEGLAAGVSCKDFSN